MKEEFEKKEGFEKEINLPELGVYKKHPYKKQIVEFSKNKKLRLL